MGCGWAILRSADEIVVQHEELGSGRLPKTLAGSREIEESRCESLGEQGCRLPTWGHWWGADKIHYAIIFRGMVWWSTLCLQHST